MDLKKGTSLRPWISIRSLQSMAYALDAIVLCTLLSVSCRYLLSHFDKETPPEDALPLKNREV
jgi:hypothetical protein